jgi:hypothetical protein
VLDRHRELEGNNCYGGTPGTFGCQRSISMTHDKKLMSLVFRQGLATKDELRHRQACPRSFAQ